MAHGSSSSGSGSNAGFSMTKFMNDFLLGGFAGAIAKTSVAPLERVKLLMQTQEANPKLAARPYTGIGNCCARVLQEEGLLAFWRGVYPCRMPVLSFSLVHLLFLLLDLHHSVQYVSSVQLH